MTVGGFMFSARAPAFFLSNDLIAYKKSIYLDSGHQFVYVCVCQIECLIKLSVHQYSNIYIHFFLPYFIVIYEKNHK